MLPPPITVNSKGAAAGSGFIGDTLVTVRMSVRKTDSPEHAHPDTREWVPQRAGGNRYGVKRLRKPMRNSDWKHCSTSA